MTEQAKKAPMTPTTLAYHIHEFADGEYNRRNRKAFMECIPEYRERVIAAAVEMFRDIHAEFAPVVKERDDLKKALGELVEAEEAVEAALLTRETLMDKDALERCMSARNLKVTALHAAKKLLEKDDA